LWSCGALTRARGRAAARMPRIGEETSTNDHKG
jgi:hypothetical protein